jgi:predicted Zn finger-like uncharacterized protein
MKLAEGIRRQGFRKWYERQLLRSHAHLALTFLCVIGVFAGIEGITRFHSASEQASDVATLLLSGAAGLWALRRYLYLLSHAESVASQAECTQCQTYGRLELVQSDASGESVRVRCRHCGHVWHIDG